MWMVRFHLTCLVDVSLLTSVTPKIKIYLEECFMYLNDMNSKRDFFDKTNKFYDERMKCYQENKEKAL